MNIAVGLASYLQSTTTIVMNLLTIQNWGLDIFNENLFALSQLSILLNLKLVLRISESNESPIIYTVLSSE